MKQVIQLISRFYPASWQRRYGTEFAALLEDVSSNWHTLLNVLTGAAEMQIRTWSFKRILVVAGLVGALTGLVALLALPNRYASIAVLKLTPSQQQLATPQTPDDYLNSLAGQSISRSYLTEIIRTLKLYKPEAGKIPIRDVVDSMEKNITIKPIGRATDKAATVFSIQFVYNDPVIAQRVVGELTGKFLDNAFDFNLHDKKPDLGGATLEVVNGPSLNSRPFSPRLSGMVTVGAASGLALGTLLTLIRRWTKPVNPPAVDELHG